METIKMQRGDERRTSWQVMALVLLRTVIGWHLLYEGLTKLFDPGWTAEGYLRGATWIFAPVFRWMASDPTILGVVDWMNAWGLTLIGLGLVLGCLTRLASLSGAGLILLYYLANPPFGAATIATEGSYFVVSKNLIEVVALSLLALFPTGRWFGLDRLVYLWWAQRQHGKPSGPDSSRDVSVGSKLSRREVIKNLVPVPLLGLFAASPLRRSDEVAADAVTRPSLIADNWAGLEELERKIPHGRIGDLDVSRLFMGFNVFKGHAHSRDLTYVRKLMKLYNEDWRVMKTLKLAEDAGINALMLAATQDENDEMPVLQRYNKEYGGNIQSFVFNFPNIPDWPYKEQVDQAIDKGASTIFICGGSTDDLVKNGNFDPIANTIDYIRKQGYAAGLGGHSITGLIECDERGIEADYYLKSFHHDNYWSAHPKKDRVDFSVDSEKLPDHNSFHDNIFCLYPERTIEWLEKLDKPFVAFKVFAGGAIPPEDGLQFAYEKGADFVCAGMMDFQIVEDVNLANDVLDRTQKRQRPW